MPEYISNDWLDMARAASVAFQAGAVTIPMRTLTERIVAVTQDPVFTFRKEHKVIPESDIVLGPIDLKARLCGAIVRTSVELLEDSPIADNLIQQVLTNAAAQTLDWALLAGDGSQTGDLDNPTGLLNWPGVHSDAGRRHAAGQLRRDRSTPTASVLANNGMPTRDDRGHRLCHRRWRRSRPASRATRRSSRRPAPIADLPKYFTSDDAGRRRRASATSRCWRGACAPA